MTNRDEIRKAIFSNAKPKSLTFEFFGAEIELRQPPMSEVLATQASAGEDRARASAEMVVRYAYVPGTDERVFDEADIDMIQRMPFGSDMANLNVKIGELTDIDLKVEEGNSEPILN